MQAARYNLEVTTTAKLFYHYIAFTFAWFRIIDHTLTLCIGSARLLAQAHAVAAPPPFRGDHYRLRFYEPWQRHISGLFFALQVISEWCLEVIAHDVWKSLLNDVWRSLLYDVCRSLLTRCLQVIAEWCLQVIADMMVASQQQAGLVLSIAGDFFSPAMPCKISPDVDPVLV